MLKEAGFSLRGENRVKISLKVGAFTVCVYVHKSNEANAKLLATPEAPSHERNVFMPLIHSVAC